MYSTLLTNSIPAVHDTFVELRSPVPATVVAQRYLTGSGDGTTFHVEIEAVALNHRAYAEAIGV